MVYFENDNSMLMLIILKNNDCCCCAFVPALTVVNKENLLMLADRAEHGSLLIWNTMWLSIIAFSYYHP